MYVVLLGQMMENSEVKYLYMGISGDISSRLRNHIKHPSRIREQKINEKIYTEITSKYYILAYSYLKSFQVLNYKNNQKKKIIIADGKKNSLKVKWISAPNVDLTDRKFYLACLERKLGYPLQYNLARCRNNTYCWTENAF